MKMRRALQERRRVDEPEERLVPARMPRELSDEELFAAQMKHHERVSDESRIVDEIERLIEDGNRREAARLLRQQRRRFPELNSVETRAFSLLARCIQSPSVAAKEAGLHFADTHPGSRLSPYLQRICKE
jgi:hypothetical protein